MTLEWKNSNTKLNPFLCSCEIQVCSSIIYENDV